LAELKDPARVSEFSKWICSLPGNHFLLEIPIGFFTDPFNAFGLEKVKELEDLVTQYDWEDVVDILSCPKVVQEKSLEDRNFRNAFSGLRDAYGLFHSRFITTPRGLEMMREKFILKQYGTCQRYYCHFQAVLPVSLSPQLNKSPVKLYCPKCRDIQHPREKGIQELDGAYF